MTLDSWKGIDPSTIITAVSTIAVATVGGFFAVWSGRKKAKSDVQGTLNSGFQILVDELQQERTELTKIVKEQGEEIALLKNHQQASDRRMALLEQTLRDNGIAPPQ